MKISIIHFVFYSPFFQLNLVNLIFRQIRIKSNYFCVILFSYLYWKEVEFINSFSISFHTFPEILQ